MKKRKLYGTPRDDFGVLVVFLVRRALEMKKIKILFSKILIALMVINSVLPVYARNIDLSMDMAGVVEYGAEDYSSDNNPGNINNQDYVRWSQPVYSYLVSANDGLVKVDATDKKIDLNFYSKDLKSRAKTTKQIKAELPLFGGFYSGEDGYYIVYGQNNPAGKEDVEVYRVVKYDKAFNRLGADSLYGENTVAPFEAGSLKMAEYGGYLYIRTCHKMYSKHQANVMIEFDEKNMKIVDKYTDVMNVSLGYVSHSFNQFIMIDDDRNIVGYDHGDAYPRGAVLGRYGRKAGVNTFRGTEGGSSYWEEYPSYDYTFALKFKEADDTNNMFVVNATGAALGDISYSAENYLASGASVAQDDTYSENQSRNIFVSAINREDFSCDIKWLTSYDAKGTTSASAPHLLKVNDNKFLVIWNINKRNGNAGSASGKVGYAFVDGNGDILGSVQNANGYISDCEPVISDGKIYWYAYDDSNTYFYCIDEKGVMSKVGGKAEETDKPSSGTSKYDTAEQVEGIYVVAKGGKLFIEEAVKDPEDESYRVECSPKGIAKISGKGVLSGKKTGECTITVTKLGQSKIYNVRVEEALYDKTVYVNRGETKTVSINGLSLLAGECKVAKPDKAVLSPLSGKEAQKHGVSDNKVAITGISYGKTGLTFMAEGKKYRINVRVCDQFIGGKDTLAVGKKLKLKVKKGAPLSSGWKSSDPSVAYVDDRGSLVAVAPGTTVISVVNNGKVITKTIHVL